jgi:lipoprotein-anchoring transpeptidase ErfK/SrfK
MGRLSAILLLFLFLPGYAHNLQTPDPLVAFLKEYLEIKYSDEQFSTFIYIAAKRQRLYFIEGDSITKKYVISTAKEGMGNLSGSYQTPEGLHKIAEKVGEGLPMNTVIKSKMATDSQAEIVRNPEATNLDLITTRVLHLKGLEHGVNTGSGKDSYLRGIFIHGTHEEGLLGTAASKGCVRMANSDIVELFKKVDVGTYVVILNN